MGMYTGTLHDRYLYSNLQKVEEWIKGNTITESCVKCLMEQKVSLGISIKKVKASSNDACVMFSAFPAIVHCEIGCKPQRHTTHWYAWDLHGWIGRDAPVRCACTSRCENVQVATSAFNSMHARTYIRTHLLAIRVSVLSKWRAMHEKACLFFFLQWDHISTDAHSCDKNIWKKSRNFDFLKIATFHEISASLSRNFDFLWQALFLFIIPVPLIRMTWKLHSVMTKRAEYWDSPQVKKEHE